MNFVKAFFVKRKLKKAAEDNSIVFESNYYQALQIHGLLVYEFGYLLRYYSEGELDSFENFKSVYDIKPYVLSAIEKDMKSDNPREVIALSISKNTAINNLKNLIKIIHSICNYHEACEKLGVRSPVL